MVDPQTTLEFMLTKQLKVGPTDLDQQCQKDQPGDLDGWDFEPCAISLTPGEGSGG